MATPSYPIKGTTVTLHPSHRPDLHTWKQHSVTMATPYNPIKGTTMTLHPSHRSDPQTRKQHNVTMATPTYPIKGKTMTLHPSYRSYLHACKLTIATSSYPIKATTLHPSHRSYLQTRKQHSATMATPSYPKARQKREREREEIPNVHPKYRWSLNRASRHFRSEFCIAEPLYR